MERRSAGRTSEAARRRLELLARELGALGDETRAGAYETTGRGAPRLDDPASVGARPPEPSPGAAPREGARREGDAARAAWRYRDLRREDDPWDDDPWDGDGDSLHDGDGASRWPAGLRPRSDLPAPSARAHPRPSSDDDTAELSTGWTGRHRSGSPDPVPAAPVDGTGARLRSLLGQGVAAAHVRLVAVGVLVVAAAVVWWVVQARPDSVVAEPVTTTGASAAGDSAAAGADPGAAAGGAESPATGEGSAGGEAGAADGGATEEDVVVAGRVRKPGIVTLPAGSRVADAITAAGGARRGTDLTPLNLARVLADGEQVVVGMPAVDAGSGAAPPSAGTTSGGASGSGPAASVNLNTATLEQLDTLPQVGPVTAQAILDWRTEHGRFSSVDELLEVRGIGEATLARLRDLVTV